MAFEGLTEKLQNALKKLSGRGKLSEADVKVAMREVRMALLEADVNFLVAKDFVKKVTDRCVGLDVLESLTPSQQVIKIVNEELTEMMGGAVARLTWSPAPPTVFMLCGLQGTGKTTMCGKLGRMLKKQGKKPLLVALRYLPPGGHPAAAGRRQERGRARFRARHAEPRQDRAGSDRAREILRLRHDSP